jgi:hypothetical protein
MTKLLIFLSVNLFFTLPAMALADFSGHWVGDGKINSNIGLNSTCSKIEIVISQTATTLVTEKYVSTCKLFGSSWGPVEMTIQGGDVFEDGEQVGTINDDTLLTIEPSGTVAYAFNLKLVPKGDGTMALQTYYGTQNSIGGMATEGLLHKVSP